MLCLYPISVIVGFWCCPISCILIALFSPIGCPIGAAGAAEVGAREYKRVIRPMMGDLQSRISPPPTTT